MTVLRTERLGYLFAYKCLRCGVQHNLYRFVGLCDLQVGVDEQATIIDQVVGLLEHVISCQSALQVID